MKTQSTYPRPLTTAFGVSTLGIIALLATGKAQGAAVVYEPFDYAVGGNLNGKTGGTGFDGAWTANTSATFATPGLTYGSLQTGGNTIGGLGVNNHFLGARGVSTALTGMLDDGDELWFSVIMGYDGGNATNTTLCIALASNQFTSGNYSYQINEAGGTGLGVFMGRFSGTNYRISAAEFRDTSFGTGFNGIVYGNPSGVEFDAGPRLVVGKFTWGASEDTLTIYLPDTNLNLGSPVSSLTVDVNQAAYDTITAERGEKVVMDELRFGATAADVLPIPEPGVALLGGLGVLGLLLRRRP